MTRLLVVFEPSHTELASQMQAVLAERVGAGNVVLGVDGLVEVGDDPLDSIPTQIGSLTAMLIVIGPDQAWLNDGENLNTFAIEQALAQQLKIIIPVLVDDAQLTADTLTSPLQPLTRRAKLTITADNIATALEPLMQNLAPAAPAPDAVPHVQTPPTNPYAASAPAQTAQPSAPPPANLYATSPPPPPPPAQGMPYGAPPPYYAPPATGISPNHIMTIPPETHYRSPLPIWQIIDFSRNGLNTMYLLTFALGIGLAFMLPALYGYVMLERSPDPIFFSRISVVLSTLLIVLQTIILLVGIFSAIRVLVPIYGIRLHVLRRLIILVLLMRVYQFFVLDEWADNSFFSTRSLRSETTIFIVLASFLILYHHRTPNARDAKLASQVGAGMMGLGLMAGASLAIGVIYWAGYRLLGEILETLDTLPFSMTALVVTAIVGGLVGLAVSQVVFYALRTYWQKTAQYQQQQSAHVPRV